MRAFVFTDRSLARHAGRFVWLAINTEQARNAPFLRRFPIAALPTFLIVDPADQKVLVRWVGGMTVAQANRLLASDPLAAKHQSRGVEAQLARADSLYGASDDSAAAVAYQRVLAEAPAHFPQYGRTVEASLFALSQTGQNRKSLTLAREAMRRMQGTPTEAAAADYGLDAALGLPAEDPERAASIAEFEKACRR